jgi:hypothetical protein
MNNLKYSLLALLISLCFVKKTEAQSIVSITPDSALQGQTLNVVITGNSTSFGQGTATTQVWLSQGSTIIPSNSVFIVSTSQMIVNITCPVSAPIGYYNVNTYDPFDSFLVLTNGFKLKSIATGINEADVTAPTVKAYPNPFSDKLSIEYSLIEESVVEITLFDISGRAIADVRSARSGIGNYSQDLQTSELPAGVYFIRLKINDRILNHKVVKN